MSTHSNRGNGQGPPTTSEVVALLRRLDEIKAAGHDPAERTRWLADKADLIARIETAKAKGEL
ncbi:hypothetical protein Ae717Ps2_0377 [Pseudonocardia sp. Ae717_Ps2]|uniref:hypothetical protein n=1 Tax=unclassified Pseudonocardia TaxID=2619320 RepID=UPI00094B0CAF|nr:MULTISPECIES: hypothetical protein [unclassified Pseudonocardia]OLM12117.1 hypothetical protein Ae505Ps2_2244 [Pseudonocardia sp. Ae505_Ps2]OLM29484.1 hypothetical protein Ae717Ps2_0377 [Pseudonocardia sp. Ae717_Ps2]